MSREQEIRALFEQVMQADHFTYMLDGASYDYPSSKMQEEWRKRLDALLAWHKWPAEKPAADGCHLVANELGGITMRAYIAEATNAEWGNWTGYVRYWRELPEAPST